MKAAPARTRRTAAVERPAAATPPAAAAALPAPDPGFALPASTLQGPQRALHPQRVWPD